MYCIESSWKSATAPKCPQNGQCKAPIMSQVPTMHDRDEACDQHPRRDDLCNSFT